MKKTVASLQIVSREIWNDALQRRLAFGMSTLEFGFKCAAPDCDAWVEVSEPSMLSFDCPLCRAKNCLKCKSAHSGPCAMDKEFEKFLVSWKELKLFFEVYNFSRVQHDMLLHNTSVNFNLNVPNYTFIIRWQYLAFANCQAYNATSLTGKLSTIMPQVIPNFINCHLCLNCYPSVYDDFHDDVDSFIRVWRSCFSSSFYTNGCSSLVTLEFLYNILYSTQTDYVVLCLDVIFCSVTIREYSLFWQNSAIDTYRFLGVVEYHWGINEI